MQARRMSLASLAGAATLGSVGSATAQVCGNKEVALKLGARYGSGGCYAQRGVDLSAFDECGWL